MGDDWFGDDPTVNRLQDRAAELTGQPGHPVPADRHDVQPDRDARLRPAGHFVVCEETAHVGGTELSSSAALSGIAFRRLAAPARGLLTAAQVAAALEPDPYDVTVVDLVAIENTHQVGGGAVLPVADLAAIRRPAPTGASRSTWTAHGSSTPAR